MHMREQSKPGGAAGDSAPPAAKRGRPIGIGSNSAALLLLRQLWLQLPVIPSHPPPSSALRSRSTPPSRVTQIPFLAQTDLHFCFQPAKLEQKPTPGWWFEEDGLFNLNDEGRQKSSSVL
ncbi:armadillo repeat-containing protein LFR-like [Salvia divinorum]|uniref:Armadillo repeat-containing protein LFR-like n=1 Tax=Salvia divinorum TaxID=28513 RepID=A0ABD1FWA6_SALDI